MAIEGIIFDLDGTLVDAKGVPVKGIQTVLSEVHKLGLRWAVVSNRGQQRTRERLSGAGLRPDYILSADKLGNRKPHPTFCYAVAHEFGIDKNRLVYIGDDDKTDGICAINAGVLYLNAGWSNANPRWGINLTRPSSILSFTKAFLLREPRWYWKVELDTPRMGHVSAKALVTAGKIVGSGGADWDPEVLRATKHVLKDDEEYQFAKIRYSRFLSYYLITTIYLEGLHEAVDWWTVYPPHGGNNHRKILTQFIDKASKLFKDRYIGDLLLRYKPAQRSSATRRMQRDPGFENQINTIRLNEEYRQRLEGKHVLVVDDFSTVGYGFEASRMLLMAGGAKQVTCISLGRYGSDYNLRGLKPGVAFDPWAPRDMVASDFHIGLIRGKTDPEALDEFLAALKPFRK